MRTVERAPAASSDQDLEALIEEARAHQRRRRRRIAATILFAAASGAVVLIGGGGGGSHGAAAPTLASRAAIRIFLARAKRGTEGGFTETYQVTVRANKGTTRRLRVIAAQRSSNAFFYRETPSLLLSRLGGPPESHSYEVFVTSEAPPGAKAGLYSCAQARPSSRWSCSGPPPSIGMGGLNELLGPYPPEALQRGLENAVVDYTGEPTGPAINPQPAFLSNQRLNGRSVSCLRFGRAPRLVGTVCLAPDGVIVFYDIPENDSSSAWETATLLTFSPHVRSDALTLPVPPR